MPKTGWRGLPGPHGSRSILSEKLIHHAVPHSQKAARHLRVCYIAAAVLAIAAVFAVMRVRYLAALCSAFSLLRLGAAQSGTLGLQDGFLSFDTPSFSVELVKDSQTLYSLKTKGNSSGFAFIPADVMAQRQSNGNYHLGDITFRARVVGSTAWISGDSSAARKNVSAQAVSGDTLAAANLLPTLPSGSLLNITRRWVVEGNHLQLLFDVTNSLKQAVEIGALGAPLEFNNVRPLCLFSAPVDAG